MGIDTPTLLGVWATPPYLHDGSAQTLAQVIENPRHGDSAALSVEDRRALAAYLLQLDDREMNTPPPPPPADAGPVAADAGDTPADAGGQPADAGVEPGDSPPAADGCGCTTTAGEKSTFLYLILLGAIHFIALRIVGKSRQRPGAG
jgi:hypothetical protein